MNISGDLELQRNLKDVHDRYIIYIENNIYKYISKK